MPACVMHFPTYEFLTLLFNATKHTPCPIKTSSFVSLSCVCVFIYKYSICHIYLCLFSLSRSQSLSMIMLFCWLQ